MIDIHCHILPGVDDGAQTIEDTIEMAKAAEREGITTIVATPHHKNPVYTNEKKKIIKLVGEVNEILKEQEIHVQIIPGQECRIYGEIIEDMEKGEILTVNESNYLLIEFPSNALPRYAKDLFYDMQLQGITPIIVHPERNQVFMEKPEKLYEFVQNGAYTQLTAGSIIGKFGKKIKSFTEEIMDAQLAHFIASDAHNVINRNFHMSAAYDEIERVYGESMVYFYRENAKLLIDNDYILAERPSEIRRRKKLFGLF